jgi:class 3 adenylate cyclase
LVLHRIDSLTRPAHVAPVVEAIEGAQLVEVDGVDVLPIAGDPDPLLAEISRFATGTTIAPAPERVVAAVLFTDLVASTDRAAAVGDEMWRSTLDGHDADVAACVSHAGGDVVKFTGDGALAVLPSTRAAISAAHSLQRRLASRGLEVRAGIHVGDIERRGSDVSGLAVNVAARIMDRAAASEILVSESVRVALLGSSASFEPADTVQLKGVPGTWPLYRSLVAVRE